MYRLDHCAMPFNRFFINESRLDNIVSARQPRSSRDADLNNSDRWIFSQPIPDYLFSCPCLESPDIRILELLLNDFIQPAAKHWQAYRKDRVKKILDLTQQMNAKRLPESERAKLPPGAIWTDQSLTRGDSGELRWLYDPDLAQEALKWVQELEQGAS